MLVFTAAVLSSIVRFTGCLSIGTGPKSQQTNPTLGQELIDLENAKNAGAITESEYQAQKAKLLANTPPNCPAK